NWANLNRARSIIAQADAQYNVAFQDFLLRVAVRYFDTLTALDGLEFAQAEELALKRQFEQAEQRFEVGLSAVTDFLEARASWDAARARVIVAENVLENSREALREITGESFETFKPLAEDLPLAAPDPAVPDEWVARALRSSPELEAARQGVEIASSDVRIARSGYLPTLDLTAGYNRFIDNELQLRDDFQNIIATTELENTGWSLGVQLNVPIFQGGAVRSRSRQAVFDERAASEDLEFQQRTVVRQTEDTFRAVMAGILEVQALEQALISAESALEATNAGFEVGTRTIVDVLLAEQRFFNSQRNYSQARHQFIVDNLALERSVGTLSPDDIEAANRRLGGPERG
ncbi:MAG: TolC family outer membrane protein, partial [Pseudomonadota bacterium]